LKLVNEKIKSGKIKKSEFGFVVSSIRQSKAGFVVLYPTKKLINDFKKRVIEGSKNRKEYL